MAPTVNDIKVDVIPDAKYLSSTTSTNNDGARAQSPIIKLETNSILAVILSRNKCRKKLFIMCVFNEFYY